MSKRIYRIWLSVAAVFVIIACVAAINYKMRQMNEKNLENSAQAEQIYVLKEYNNAIGVYKDGENTPFRKIDVYVKSLPAYDRQALRLGVRAVGDKQLRTAIEDYES